MAKIIATAENYAFGPVGKLVTVCEQLLKKGHHITFIGEGTAYQLASKVNFHEIYKHNTDSPDFMKWGTPLFLKADVLLSSVDRSSVLLAKKINLPVIWLDMLFWWWDVLPDYLYDVDLYIQQNSIKNDRNMKLYAPKIKNMKIVGPIVDTSFKSKIKKKKQLLIGFGGTEAAGWYKIGEESMYPFTIAKLIVDSVDTDKYDQVLFAGNERVMNLLSKKYGASKFKFCMLSHDRWLEELATSEDILLNPGLEAPLEAFVYEIPVFFLPPYNASSYVQLDEFRSQGVVKKTNSIHLSDYFPAKFYAGKNLRAINTEFFEELKTFEKSNLILKDCANRIDKYLHYPREKKLIQIKSQQDYIHKLGSDGLTETVKHVDKYVSGLNRKYVARS